MTMSRIFKFFFQVWALITVVMVFMSIQSFLFPADAGFADNARLYLGSDALLKALAESFYYAALALGIWTIINRRKERKAEAEAAAEAETETARTEIESRNDGDAEADGRER